VDPDSHLYLRRIGAGAFVITHVFPSWAKAIRKLMALPVDVVVPGHGDRLDPGLLPHTLDLVSAMSSSPEAKQRARVLLAKFSSPFVGRTERCETLTTWPRRRRE
jgi:hypothetical protein